MKSLVCTLLLMMATIAFGQQPQTPSTPPFNPNAQPNGNNAPPNQQSPAEQMPPDTRAPAHNQTGSPDIEKELQAAFDHEPVLKGTDLKATADDDSVVVSGTVETNSSIKSRCSLSRAKPATA